jgi:hypothetical protein
MERRADKNPPGVRLVHRAAKWRRLPSLLVINARQFNDGSGSGLKNGVSASPYGWVFRRPAATARPRRQQIVAFAHYRQVQLASMVVSTGSFMD